MIIAIASGKGGTGKTLVATSLAVSIQDSHKVQLLDCDVEEPDDHIFLKPAITGSEPACIPVPRVNDSKCTYCGKCAQVCPYNAIAVAPEKVLVFPQLCHGCGACSYLCPEDAITEEDKQIGKVEWDDSSSIAFVHGKLNVGEAMAVPVIRKVKEKTSQDRVMIIDASPGTSCPVVEAVKGSHFCLLVTEPTPFGLNDLVLAVEMTKELKIPCGVIINRAGLGDSKAQEYCARENIPILLTIPLDTDIARLYSKGITLAEGMPHWRESFLKLFKDIEEIAHEGT